MSTRSVAVPLSESWRIDQAILEIVAVAATMTLAAWVRVQLPFSPVPFTLQTMVVLLFSLTMRPQRVSAGMLLFISLGLVGFPILAAAPFGPSFGYLVGFAGAPFIVHKIRNTALGVSVASGFILTLGAGWLMLWMGTALSHAFLLGVVPFLPGDAAKAVGACVLAKRLIRRPGTRIT